MGTYTVHRHERHHHGATEWTLQHPAMSTVVALAAAVVVGVLVGILFSVVLSGTESRGTAPGRRARLTTVTQAHHAAAAAAAQSPRRNRP